MLQRKRVYDTYDAEKDGKRVLVDRLWPRGVKKEDAHVDEWLKDITPSKELREWYHSEEGDFSAFSKLYKEELDERPAAHTACQQVKQWAADGVVTLIYAAKDREENHVVVLMDYIAQLDKE